MDWIQNRSDPQRILCMTGAAGAGKSALQQTVAERCADANILGAAFFFDSTDPTRNTGSAFVGTIAYQLGLKHPPLQSAVIAAVNNNPFILSWSIQSQMDALIVRPFKNLQSNQVIDIKTFPHVILIDGLDACMGEDQQAELLAAISHCILGNDLPFIASRPELAIRSALEPGGHLHGEAYHIQLSDKYDASEDMNRFLQRRFKDIGLRINNPTWFAQNDVKALVEAASGQFFYVAAIYKYISQRRTSPEEMLKIVLNWTPHEHQGRRPFEVLDRLYTSVLLAAKQAYEGPDTHHGRDFLLVFRAHHINITGFDFLSGSSVRHPANHLSTLLHLEPRAEENLILDLRSLVTLETGEDGHSVLRLYHKSFSDFLEAPSRAKDLFVPRSRVAAHLAECCMRHIIECPLDFDSRA
jgi:hypothetical protein